MPLSKKRRLTLAASVSLLFFLGGELPSSAQQAASFTYDQRGRLTVFVAPDGTITKYVYDAAGNISSIERGTAADLMRIDSVTPNTGVVPGNTLTIVGQNFDPVASNNTVLFTGVSGSVPALVTSASATQLTVQVPQGAVTGAIRVQRLGQTVTGPVIAIQTLSVASISPTSPVVSGSTITLTGQGFSLNANGNTISFFGAGGTSIPVTVTTADPTQLSLQVPAGAVSGLISVSSGTQSITGSNVQIQTLTISGVTPAGPYLPGATITLAGQGFSLLPSGNIVTFAGANGTTIPVPVTTSSPASLTLQIPQTAVSGALSISVAPQTVAGSNIQLQTLQITSISPNTPVVSGTRITINGQFFSPEIGGNAVRFTGANGTTISVNPITATSTQLIVEVPAGVVTGNVAVTTGGQTAQGSILQIQTLQVTGITPAGPYVPGSTITLTGQGFSLLPGGNIINFAGANGTTIPVTVTTSNSASLTLQIPQEALTGALSVSVAPQTAAGANIQIQALQITGITPAELYQPGSTITLTGQGFSLLPGGNIINFAGANGTTIPVTVTTNNSAALSVQIPQGTVTGSISVTVGSRTSTGPILNVYYFTPTTGAAGSSVTITGGGFVNPSVTFNGAPATITASSSNSITAEVPVTATTGSLVLTSNGLSKSLGNFTMLTTVTGFTPSTGIPGSSITVTGSGFNNPSLILIDDANNVLTTTSSSSTQITARLPVTLSSGSKTLRFNSASFSQALGNFTVTLPFTVSYVSPSLGAPGSSVSIVGSGFSNPSVSFNGIPAAITQSSATNITAIVPPNAPPPLTLVSSGIPLILPFTVLKYLVSGFTPASGSLGSSVTITGFNFIDPTVSFNGVPAVITQSSSTSITATVPLGATSGPLNVVSEGYTTTIGTFSVQPFTISGFTPASGSGGSSVTIAGFNFINPTVSFNGVPAVITQSSSTSITVTVPLSATSGPLNITDQGTTKTAGNFTVLSQASSYSPQSGNTGSSVTITGANLLGATVSFNGVQATITSNTATSITAIVPAYASTGPISVSANGQQLELGTYEVIPTFSGFTPATGGVGAEVTISGTGLQQLAISFNGIPATVLSNTAVSLQVRVPDGATTGLLKATTSINRVYELGTFTVGAVTAAAPQKFTLPVAAPGQQVTIVGTNFNAVTAANTIVKVNGVTAQIANLTATNLTFTVPNIAIDGYASDTPGLAATVTVETLGGIATVPKTLYLVPNISFVAPLDVGTPVAGNLNNLGDNGLIKVPALDVDNRLLGINATRVSGSGRLQVFIFTPDGDFIQRLQLPKDADFTLTDGLLQRTGRLNLPGEGDYIFQVGFDLNAGQATGEIHAGLAASNTLTTLHTFTGTDGAYPNTRLTLGADGAFYGATYSGGQTQQGFYYRITPAGAFSVLHELTGNEGEAPNPLLKASDGFLYGTTFAGGANSKGTLLRLATNGTVQVLHAFAGGNSDGEQPRSDLVQSADGNIYGTTFLGGSIVSEGRTYTTNSGVAFRLSPSGSYSIATNFVGSIFFTSTGIGTTPEQPLGRLALSSDGILSGTSQQSCSNTPCGEFFQRTLLGSTSIASIPLTPTTSPSLTSSNGVVQGRDGAFYGVIDTDLNTYGGIFRVRPGDSRATIIKSFDNDFGSGAGELNLGPDGNFYGVVYYGGGTGDGQVYRMEPDGTTVGLYSFTGGEDGRNPSNGIVWGPDGNLYGVANSVADGTYGNVFRLTIQGFPIVNTASTNQGSPGSGVVLTGVNLQQTLAVKFNGTPAQFTVNSPTQITAIVPTGATSGLISVTNLFGSATAPTRFTVP
jgi:uncharacterized repeat protein (TIGR03803 family)/YD repeat-containing protein